jgi:hypothetical protein
MLRSVFFAHMQVMHKYQKQLPGRPTLASKRAERANKDALEEEGQEGTTGAPSSPSGGGPPPAAMRRRRTMKQ